MSISVVVDSICDLSAHVGKQLRLQYIPRQVLLGNETLDDTRDSALLSQFYSKLSHQAHEPTENKKDELEDFLTRQLAANSESSIATSSLSEVPFSPDHAHYYLTENFLDAGNFLIVLAGDKAFTSVFNDVSTAQPFVLKTYRGKRERGTVEGHFGIRLVDTGCITAGLGLLAYRVARQIAEGGRRQDVITDADVFAHQIETYTVLGNPNALNNMLKIEGGFFKSVGLTNGQSRIILTHAGQYSQHSKHDSQIAAAEALFKHASERVKNGLAFPGITISIAGELNILKEIASYKLLVEAAETVGAKISVSLMSMTAASRIGAGSISVAYAPASVT